MAEPEKGDRILRSWKEIAAHLGVDGRTCARWEENFGLPVHRAQGEGKKSRVFAYRDELDAWFQTTFRNHQKGANATARRTSPPKIRLWSLPVIAFVAIGAWLLVPLMKPTSTPSDRVPADFRIEGSFLVILNKTGQPLWSHDTGLINLLPDERYQDLDGNGYIPAGSAIIRDLQGDGRQEVLFATQTSDELLEGDLYCFNDQGTRLWRFHAGRELRFGGKVYSADYRIGSIDASDLDGDGRMEVILTALHNPEWPCQISSLSCDGALLGEYWNSGAISDFIALDLDADGQKELIAAGQNNEYRKGCFVVLATPGFRGSSPNSAEFSSPDLPLGGEMAYLLLPRTGIDQMEGLYESCKDVGLLANGNIRAYTHISCLFFEFRPDLTLKHIMDSHSFQGLHRKYYEAGKVKTPYTEEEYIKPLEKQVLYFDGQGWTTTPTTRLKPAR